MNKGILILLLFYIGFVKYSQAQVVRYYYTTYGGKPVSEGWLMFDTTYKMVYDKLNFQTKMIYSLKKLREFDSTLIYNQERMININNDVIVDLKLLNEDCANKLDSVTLKADSLYMLSSQKVDKTTHKKVVRRTIFQSLGVGFVTGVLVVVYIAIKVAK